MTADDPSSSVAVTVHFLKIYTNSLSEVYTSQSFFFPSGNQESLNYAVKCTEKMLYYLDISDLINLAHFTTALIILLSTLLGLKKRGNVSLGKIYPDANDSNCAWVLVHELGH